MACAITPDDEAPVGLAVLAPDGGIGVLAPHPDDESLGCGGLIATALDQGRAVCVVALTDGSGSHPGSKAISPPQLAAMRGRELRCALAALGLPPWGLLATGLPDGALSSADLGLVCNRIIERFAPLGVRHVFAPVGDDPHPDHRAAYAIAGRVAAGLGAALWVYPVRAQVVDAAEASGGFRRLDIARALQRKRAAIACHRSQLGQAITDDPDGFHLMTEDLERHGRPYELFRQV